MINCNGCLYVKNTDEVGIHQWANALTLCTNLGAGWYLPDKFELDALYRNYNQPSNGGTCQGGPCPLSGFNAYWYWSSTVYDASAAWWQRFDNGTQEYRGKIDTYGVRCVRR